MILADTSVWVAYLREGSPTVDRLLRSGEIGTHPLVIDELTEGRLADRDRVVDALRGLRTFPRLTHSEVMVFGESHWLWGRGLAWPDVHLMGSVLLAQPARLWTREPDLVEACRDVGIPHVTERRTT